MPESPLFAVPMLEGGSDYPTPDATADAKQINDQIKYAESFWGVKPVTSGTLPSSPKTQQLVHETDSGRTRYWNGSEWVILASPDRGTTAQRNSRWGTPGDASARVALANQGALWFNTETGYWQQYFAQFDDAGAGAVTPVKKTHGWRAIGSDRIPIVNFTASGGTPANVKKYGNTVELSGTSISFLIDGVFTTDFDLYEIEIYVPTTTGTGSALFGLRTGGAAAPSTHAHQRVAATASSVTSASASGLANMTMASIDTAAHGWLGKIRVQDPMVSNEFTHGLWEGGCPGTNRMDGTFQLRTLSQVDGFSFSGGPTFNAHSLVRVWGLSNGL